MNKHLLVMAGGTGGHVFPALAVADYLRERGWQVSWLGTRGRLEERVVPAAGIDLHYIDVQGVRGHGVLRKVFAPVKILRSIMQARRIIKTLQPDVVLGMGGYAAGPGGVAARLSGIPLLLHEQNAAAGLTNRLLSRIANRILVAFAGPFAKRAEVVGNPIRADFVHADVAPRKPDSPLKLLVVGGSLGARVLNQQVPDGLAQCHGSWQVRHQCGQGGYEETLARYQQHGLCDVEVLPFIDDIADHYRWADLVICRAGALTVSELAAVGVASVLVPLPHAVDDHQSKNARQLSEVGAGVLLPQAELTGEALAALLSRFAEQPQQLQQMAVAAQRIARLDATERVAAVVCELAERTR